MKEEIEELLQTASNRIQEQGESRVLVELIMAVNLLPDLIKSQRDAISALHKLLQTQSTRIDGLQAQIHVLSEELLMLKGERED